MNKLPLIIGVSGHIGSGKSTFSSMLKEALKLHGINCVEKNFADALKQVCFILTGYHGYTQEEKNIYLEQYGMTVGTALQKLGSEVLRDNFDKDVWVKATFSTIPKEVNSVPE